MTWWGKKENLELVLISQSAFKQLMALIPKAPWELFLFAQYHFFRWGGKKQKVKTDILGQRNFGSP